MQQWQIIHSDGAVTIHQSRPRRRERPAVAPMPELDLSVEPVSLPTEPELAPEAELLAEPSVELELADEPEFSAEPELSADLDLDDEPEPEPSVEAAAEAEGEEVAPNYRPAPPGYAIEFGTGRLVPIEATYDPVRHAVFWVRS